MSDDDVGDDGGDDADLVVPIIMHSYMQTFCYAAQNKTKNVQL